MGISVIHVEKTPVVGASNAFVQVLEDAGSLNADGAVVVSAFVAKMLNDSAASGFAPSDIASSSLDCQCGEPRNASLIAFLFVEAPTIVGSVAATGGNLRFVLRANSNGQCDACYITLKNKAGAQVTASPFSIVVVPVNDAPSFTVPTASVPYNSAAGSSVPIYAYVDVFEGSANVVIPNWATSISPGPTPDESSQALSFSLTATSGTDLRASTYFDVVPVISAANGNLAFSLKQGLRASSYSPFEFSVVLVDSGGTAYGGVDRTAAGGLLLRIRVAATVLLPSFQSGDAIYVLEDAGSQLYTQWASEISSGSASSITSLRFALVVDTPILFSATPHITVPNGDLYVNYMPNRYGVSSGTVYLTNGSLASVPHILSITVVGVNDAPTFNPQFEELEVLEDSKLPIIGTNVSAASVLDSRYWYAASISAGPYEESQKITFVLSCQSSTSTTLFPSGSLVIATDSGFITRLSPTPDGNGVHSCSVVLRDDGGTLNGGVDTSTSQQLRIVVKAVNDAPSCSIASSVVSLQESDSSVAISFLSGAQQRTALTGAAATTEVIVRGLMRSCVAGPADEVASQTLSFDLLSCSSPLLPLFTVAPRITDFDGSTANVRLTLLANASGSVQCTATLHDSGGVANGGVDAYEMKFTLVVSGANKAPFATVVAPYIDVQPNTEVAQRVVLKGASSGSPYEDEDVGIVDSIASVGVATTATSVFSVQPKRDVQQHHKDCRTVLQDIVDNWRLARVPIHR